MTKPTEKLFETKAEEQIFDLKGFLRELEGNLFQKEQRYVPAIQRMQKCSSLSNNWQRRRMTQRSAAVVSWSARSRRRKRSARRNERSPRRGARQKRRSRGEAAAAETVVHSILSRNIAHRTPLLPG